MSSIRMKPENGCLFQVHQWSPMPETGYLIYQPGYLAEYVISFDQVTTKAIRIIGDAMIQDHWNKYTKQVSGFTSITELSVYKAGKD